jgi:hypothetical protein
VAVGAVRVGAGAGAGPGLCRRRRGCGFVLHGGMVGLFALVFQAGFGGGGVCVVVFRNVNASGLTLGLVSSGLSRITLRSSGLRRAITGNANAVTLRGISGGYLSE